MSELKPIMQCIVDSIDEELRERTGLTGREVYLRGLTYFGQAEGFEAFIDEISRNYWIPDEEELLFGPFPLKRGNLHQ